MSTATSVPPPAAPAGSGARFRRWRDLGDIDGMAAANGRLRAHAGVLEPIDTEAMRHRYTHLVNSDPPTDCIVAERDGEILGYARVEWHDLVDGDRVYDLVTILQPSAWGLGTYEAMLDWCEARALELAGDQPTERRSYLAQEVPAGDTELARVLAGRGYAEVRWAAEMLRPHLDDVPDVALPEGYELRIPEPAELPAIHAMMVEAFSEHWGEHEASDQVYEEWVEDPRFRRDLVVVAWRGTEPAAVVCNILETMPDGTLRGLLDGVCTHPGHRRLGLARAAIARSLALLRAEGATSAYLGVDTGNHNRALALYESCGFRVASSATSYRKPLPGTEANP